MRQNSFGHVQVFTNDNSAIHHLVISNESILLFTAALKPSCLKKKREKKKEEGVYDIINKKYHMLDQHHYLLPIKFTILFCCLASFFTNFPSIGLLFRKIFKISSKILLLKNFTNFTMLSNRHVVVDMEIDSCFSCFLTIT